MTSRICVKTVRVALLALFLVGFPCGMEPRVNAAEVEETETKIVIGYAEFEPFIMKAKKDNLMNAKEGEIIGFEVDVWGAMCKTEVLNLDPKKDSVYNEVLFKDIFTGLEQGQLNMGMCGITINRGREDRVNFSFPTYDSDFGIMVKGNLKKPSLIMSIGDSIFSRTMLILIAFLLAGRALFGLVLWFVERKNPHIPNQFLHRDPDKSGFEVASWVIWQFMTTIGSGDWTPKTRLGRILTVPNFFYGAIVLSSITGLIGASLVIDRMEYSDSKIQSLEDLRGKMVATVIGTTSEKAEALKNVGAKIVPFAKVQDAYKELLSEDIEAVFYDIPVLKYYANTAGNGKVVVIEETIEPQKYGFAFQSDNIELQEQVNRALLEVIEDGTYDKIYKKWFGDK